MSLLRVITLVLLAAIGAGCSSPPTSDETSSPAQPTPRSIVDATPEAATGWTALSFAEALDLSSGADVAIVAPLFWHGDGRVSICASHPSGDDGVEWCGRPSAEVFSSHEAAVTRGVRPPTGDEAADHHLSQLALVEGTIEEVGVDVRRVDVVAPDRYPGHLPMTSKAFGSVPVGLDVAVRGQMYSGVDGQVVLCAGLGESWPPSCGGPRVVLGGVRDRFEELMPQSCCGDRPFRWWVDGAVVVRGVASDTGIDVESVDAVPTGWVMSIDDVPDFDAGTDAEVAGITFWFQDEVRLCSGVLESSPPQCGEPSITVHDAYDVYDAAGLAPDRDSIPTHADDWPYVVVWPGPWVIVRGEVVDGELWATSVRQGG